MGGKEGGRGECRRKRGAFEKNGRASERASAVEGKERKERIKVSKNDKAERRKARE